MFVCLTLDINTAFQITQVLFENKLGMTHSLTHYTKKINRNNGVYSMISRAKSAENQSIKPFADFQHPS